MARNSSSAGSGAIGSVLVRSGSKVHRRFVERHKWSMQSFILLLLTLRVPISLSHGDKFLSYVPHISPRAFWRLHRNPFALGLPLCLPSFSKSQRFGVAVRALQSQAGERSAVLPCLSPHPHFHARSILQFQQQHHLLVCQGQFMVSALSSATPRAPPSCPT